MKINNVQIQDLKELEEIIAVAEKAKAAVEAAGGSVEIVS